MKTPQCAPERTGAVMRKVVVLNFPIQISHSSGARKVEI